MKIAVNTGNYEILNSIIRTAKENGHTIAIAKLEKSLFDHIDNEDVDAFVISGGTDYAQKAVDFIRKFYSYIPIIIIGKSDEYKIKNADIVFPFNQDIDVDVYSKSILNSIYSYVKNFETLKRLTANIGDVMEFADCKYDPTKRLLYYKGEEFHKLSPKQAGIFEILAANFGMVVKKEIILEKVWHDSNYFVGRSLDVFVTHLRKILRQGNTDLAITNVSNIGLLLDYNSKIK
jgi:DNA-binding winged helix-turn-helix (wHTH) protein